MEAIMSKLDYDKPVVPLFVQAPPKYEQPSERTKFYQNAKLYWANIPATLEGVLGGYAHVSEADLAASKTFLKSLSKLGKKNALDCGAGIGRVTKSLLASMFSQIDVVEQDFKFAKKIDETLPHFTSSIRIIYNMGLQDFAPKKQKYDLIWCQWVLGYLTNDDVYAFLLRARDGLKKGGYLVLKENIAAKRTEFNADDSSYTRTLKHYETMLKAGGMRITNTLKQPDYPNNLCPVYMIACQVAATGCKECLKLRKL